MLEKCPAGRNLELCREDDFVELEQSARGQDADANSALRRK
jgi:hypothetical protein